MKTVEFKLNEMEIAVLRDALRAKYALADRAFQLTKGNEAERVATLVEISMLSEKLGGGSLIK